MGGEKPGKGALLRWLLLLATESQAPGGSRNQVLRASELSSWMAGSQGRPIDSLLPPFPWL